MKAWILGALLIATAGEARPNSRAAAAATAAGVARDFVASLLLSDPRRAAELATFPFYLEDQRIGSAQELASEWGQQLRSKRIDLLTLDGLEVLTPGQMVRRYGKPPPKLADWPTKGKSLLAVVNLSGRGAVLLLREEGRSWRVAGYHD